MASKGQKFSKYTDEFKKILLYSISTKENLMAIYLKHMVYPTEQLQLGSELLI